MRSVQLALFLSAAVVSFAQDRPGDARGTAVDLLLKEGYRNEDVSDLVLKDSYTTDRSAIQHSYFVQRWQGIEIWNAEVVIHRSADGGTMRMNNGAWRDLAKRVNATLPAIDASTALGVVISRTTPGASLPALVTPGDQDHRWVFEGSQLGGEPVYVKLVYQPVGDSLRLAWNVNHYTNDGAHWWNVRIDALTGEELDRNDWVTQCDLGHPHEGADPDVRPVELSAPAPAGPNDYRVYPWPLESPSHGPRSIRTAPWLDGGIASPYGWHDTNGANGAEYTITRGNNVWAKEDIAADNEATIGFSPNGGATLDLDFTINLANAPNTNQSAVITNLFYWNNVIHDVWYGYGFDEVSGNFQQNNYGRGGTGNDYVLADALDGSGTNNANFGTPGDGARPRMQMFVWTAPNPDRTSDLDNGIIAHEYGHGISNRLVGGPNNTNCLSNAEQMGEGWSDFISLIMTIKAGDVGTTGRGIGTYVLGQPVTGAGIRPARYSTSFGVNGYTYAATNNAAISQPHGIGFVWCTILWEVTWELIGIHGLDPDIYNGTGGNNIMMQLVIDGMKLTPCNPGFVDARDAILLADQINNGGANQAALWAAFARRGLGFSASQGSSASRSDQVEAFDLPLPNNVGIASIQSPQAGQMLNCSNSPVTVTALVRNFGTQPQSNFPVRYQLDGGPFVTQTFTGTLAPNASALFTFTQQVSITGTGGHTVVVSTALAGDQYAGDNSQSVTITVIAGTTITAPVLEGLSTTSPTPPGWRIENPDNAITWSTTNLANGPTCALSRAWSIDQYTYNGAGQEDRLITPLIDLSGIAGSRLRFSHSYARYNASYFDGFRVDISNNCGGNWTTLYNASGSALATAPDNTAAFQPANCAQWFTHDIDLGAYDGQTVLIRFVAICGYGNFLYMDNVEVFGTGTPLPVELITFDAKSATDGILLDWVTVSERNSARFELERSADLVEWGMIASIDAAGQSQSTIAYRYLDKAPKRGTNYYRLRMVDDDGSWEYSGIASADWIVERAGPWPNPSHGEFRLELAHADVPVSVFDALGNVVPTERTITVDGMATFRLLEVRSGMYFIRIGPEGASTIERIMVLAD